MINYYSTSLERNNAEATFFLRLLIFTYQYDPKYPKYDLFLLDLSEIIIQIQIHTIFKESPLYNILKAN